MAGVPYVSQIGQDRFVIEDVFNHRTGGFFVDIGAYDGMTISNTYVLEKYFGWEGICVEPSTQFEKLKINRACHCENSCLADAEGEIEFVESGWDSCGKGYGKNNASGGKAVRTRTLRSVLQQYKAPAIIDYLSLDVEGMEFEILKNFDFGTYVFKVITVEHNHMKTLRENLGKLLTSNGYRCVLSPGIEDWYLHESVNMELDGRRYAELYFMKWHELWECRQQVRKLNNQRRFSLAKFFGFK